VTPGPFLSTGFVTGSCGVFFARGRLRDCTAFAIDAIDRAEQQILVSASGLTTSSSTVEALVRAKQRGIDVRLIADRTTPCERHSGMNPLARAGIPIWIDYGARIAHAKSMVIDGKVTPTGSMN
jgi:phosphatidylserine/phosphatidylglycerophosphate/cardiolipin synthase-like enzyme